MKNPHSHLEDFCEDIIAKAQNGLRLTNRELAERARIDLSTLRALKNGEPLEDPLRRIAPILGLDPERLVTSARKAWFPSEQKVSGLQMFVSEFRTMTVNAYLLTAPTGEALLFDTGVDPDPILQYIEEKEITLEAILLTHGHPDHVAVLDPIASLSPQIPVYAHPSEGISRARALSWGESFPVGPFQLRAVATPGHTPGGTSFLLQQHSPPLAIVGDALFAGSVGGCAADYENALAAIRENLLSLPPETLVCPGHGPISTVGEERDHNPFFPG